MEAKSMQQQHLQQSGDSDVSLSLRSVSVLYQQSSISQLQRQNTLV
jgi:hypothetical protein